MTGADLLKLPDIKWLWPGYIPRGHLTAVVGQPGSGKSAFVEDLARRVSLGGKWPDGSQIKETGKTLYIDAEGAKSIVAQRLKDWRMNPEDFILPYQEDFYADFTLNALASKQIKNILELYKPKLVVLDSLTGIHSKEEKSAQEMKKVLNELKSWAAIYNVAVVVVHHLNKENPAFKSQKINIDRVRGSTHIVAAVRSVLAIDQIEVSDIKMNVHQIYQIKNNLAQLKEEPLYFEIGDKGLTYIPPRNEFNLDVYVSKSQIDKAGELILDYLKDGPIKATVLISILEEAGISETTGKRAKEFLPVKSYKTGKEWFWKRTDLERG